MSENHASEDPSPIQGTAELARQGNEEDLGVITDEMQDRQLEMIDIARTNAELAFDFARELASAKTPSELMQLCMTHAQKQFTAVSEPTAEVTMTMSNAYIEARPKGRQEFYPIDAFVVEDDAGQVLGTFDTQMEAIIWAKEAGHEAQVARNRDLGDKKNPDHWRSF